MSTPFIEFMHRVRLYELDQAIEILREAKPSGSKLLEIGAGSGWQAKGLAERGYEVEAIDLKDSSLAHLRIWDIKDYDGVNIPFPDSSFDVVFSSNVLEHIPGIEAFQSEVHRVLKADGVALHILPTGAWRAWTNITYYPFAMSYGLEKLCSRLGWKNSATLADRLGDHEERRTKVTVGWLLSRLLPPRHGEFGNSFTEAYYFSKLRWARLFKDTGWEIMGYKTNRIIYTGYSALGRWMSDETRRRLSRILGSSCHFFLLKKTADHFRTADGRKNE